MNKYEIKGIVGEGAYGIVYQARHKETGEIGKLSWNQSYRCLFEPFQSTEVWLDRFWKVAVDLRLWTP